MKCKCLKAYRSIKALKESAENEHCLLECEKSQFGYAVSTINGYCMPLETMMMVYGIENPQAWIEERGGGLKQLAMNMDIELSYYEE